MIFDYFRCHYEITTIRDIFNSDSILSNTLAIGSVLSRLTEPYFWKYLLFHLTHCFYCGAHRKIEDIQMVLRFDDCFCIGSCDYRRANGTHFWHPRMDVRRQLKSHLPRRWLSIFSITYQKLVKHYIVLQILSFHLPWLANQ